MHAATEAWRDTALYSGLMLENVESFGKQSLSVDHCSVPEKAMNNNELSEGTKSWIQARMLRQHAATSKVRGFPQMAPWLPKKFCVGGIRRRGLRQIWFSSTYKLSLQVGQQGP